MRVGTAEAALGISILVACALLLGPLTPLRAATFASAASPERARIVVVLHPQANDGSPENSLAEQNLPSGSAILVREASFWDQYKWRAIVVIALCIAQALLIAGLLVQRARLRRAEGRFRQAVRAAPNGMLFIGQDGNIVLANPQIEKMFGYSSDELVGQCIEMLMPVRNRNQHLTDRAQYFLAPEARPMGAGRQLFGLRKDGSEFPVEIGLGPLRTSAGPFVLASVIDMTQRRQTEDELQQSQSQLRRLSGELLHAQEDERRRIAREIHDDFNQSLALLCVELELLGKASPESPEQLSERTDELSAQVRQLASSLHRLSHELHPLKLEQLGLTVAVQSLCQEIAANHGLGIEFECRQTLEMPSKDTALCFYRIVQEALSNVIKHSGARHASVELSRSADRVTLHVSDDGHGFDFDSVIGKGGLGLVSMRERLLLVGGEFVVHSSLSGGTRIEAWVPAGAEAESNGNVQTVDPAKIWQDGVEVSDGLLAKRPE